jgi:hypothetical protein
MTFYCGYLTAVFVCFFLTSFHAVLRILSAYRSCKSLQTLFPDDVATEVLTAYDVGDLIKILTETSDFQIFNRYC